VMNYPADKLAAFLASPDASAARYVVSVQGEEAGVVSVRHPWLKGPYLELLALLPEAQSQGIGSSIIAWFESAGLRHRARNLWVCASSFNARALRFYERHGFTRPRRRRLRRNSAAQISARPSAVARRLTRRSLAAAHPDRCRGCPSRRRPANDRQTTHRPRSRRSHRPSIRTHRHSRA
jgi:ribosomal protein S18 acetylase RimI-like enzyme